jgi:hypothetical protein
MIIHYGPERIAINVYANTRPDFRSRESMVDYAATHPTYRGRFAHCVKLPSLGFGKGELFQRAARALESEEFFAHLRAFIRRFEMANPGLTMCSEGHSNGWMVMATVGGRYAPRPVNSPGANASELGIDELRALCRDLRRFDNGLESIRKSVIGLLREFQVVTETVQVPRLVHVLRPAALTSLPC